MSARPDSTSLARLRATPTDCGATGRPTSDEGTRLYRHIANGNGFALHAALGQLECFDGGEIEDLFISIGTFFDAAPRRVVSIVGRYGIRDEIVAIIITMTPETVDDNAAAMAIYGKRLRALEGIRETEHARVVKVWSEELRTALATRDPQR